MHKLKLKIVFQCIRTQFFCCVGMCFDGAGDAIAAAATAAIPPAIGQRPT